MSAPALTLVVLAIAALGWRAGRRRAFAVAGGPANAHTLHSRPAYFGALTAIWCAVPALLLLCLWVLVRGSVVTGLVVADLPPELRDLPGNELALVVNDVRNQVEGNFVRDDAAPHGIRPGGEGGATPALRVLVNAVCHALKGLGVRHVPMPMTPEWVWRAITEVRRNG